MKYYVLPTQRSHAEAERLGFNIEGLQFKIHSANGDQVRGYVVVPYMAWSIDKGPVYLTMYDLEERE